MNIILFHPAEVELPLSRRDERSRHLLEVLRRRIGDSFDAGLVNGPRGRGTITAITEKNLQFSFAWADEPPLLCPIHLVIGLPRPQTARAILREATSLGIAAIHFVHSDKGETSYAQSSLWHSTEWQECLLKGAAQAFCTRLPAAAPPSGLEETLAGLPLVATRIALDNYEAPAGLSEISLAAGQTIVLALGSERGWAERERQRLRTAEFVFAHLGSRVLRTETACLAAITLIKAKLGWL